MVHSTTKAPRAIRPLGIMATGTISYFLTLLLVLYVLDRQIYTAKKMAIIRENFYGIFNPPEELNDFAHDTLFGATPADRARAKSDLEKMMQSIVNGPTSIYRMELLDADKALVTAADDRAKIGNFNSWRNSLFTQNFSGFASQFVSRARRSEEHGRLVSYYTSPINYPPIERLTNQYRIVALLVVALWAAVYAFLYRNLLRPVRNVTLHLERSREAAPRLIWKSRAHLESAYNQLATRALLQLIEERLNSPTRPDSHGQAQDRTAAVNSALSIAAQAFGVERLDAAEISVTGEHVAIAEFFSAGAAGEHAEQSAPELFRALTAGAPLGKLPEEGRLMPDSPAFSYVAPLSAGSYLVIVGRLDQHLPGENQRLEALERVCTVLRRGFVAYKAYREGIFRQRSEANIVLSRNLGHDLTNIIATSKLDLMAVRRLLEAPGQESESGARGELLREAVNGLLENTKFLQEMVNIYRSFSHVKRPQYERRDLRLLIEEFLAAFEPSVSSRISIKRDLQQMPAPILEPRLIKLALFNVLTNSLDALRRVTTEELPLVIHVRTKYEEEKKLYRIEIDDNGPGIRDQNGNLLAPAELQAIFEYGYSTKSESSEGLGLSWVRTIMSEFHDGSVTAENRPEGGARFSLLLRSMERSEAKVG